jgi:predicted transcriptional regulator
MKHILTILLVFLITGSSLMAQKIQVTEDKKRINGSNREVLFVEIPNVQDKDVEKAWKNLMKDYDAEKVKSRKEVFADNVLIPPVSNNTIDVYARAEENNGQVEFYVAVDLGGAYMGSDHPDEISAMKSIIEDFAVKLAKEAYEEMQEGKADAVEDIQKEIESLNKGKEHLQKKNEKYQEKIEDNLEEIQELEKALEEQKKLLEDAQKELKQVKKNASKVD